MTGITVPKSAPLKGIFSYLRFHNPGGFSSARVWGRP
jgi:hypothetical protein